MRCQKCHKSKTKIIESRSIAAGTSVRRRQECLKCKGRFSTYELQELPAVAKQVKLIKNALVMISNTKDDAWNQTMSAKIANDVLYKLM